MILVVTNWKFDGSSTELPNERLDKPTQDPSKIQKKINKKHQFHRANSTLPVPF